MDTRKEEMTRREFFKKTVMAIGVLALFASPLKSFADIFSKPNVSDKEARYYRTLTG